MGKRTIQRRRARTARREAERAAVKRPTGVSGTPVDASRLKFMLDGEFVAILDGDVRGPLSHCEPSIVEPGTRTVLDFRDPDLHANEELLRRWKDLQLESLAQRLRGQSPDRFAKEAMRAREGLWVSVNEGGEAHREQLGDLAARFGAPIDDLTVLASKNYGLFTVKENGSLSAFIDPEAAGFDE